MDAVKVTNGCALRQDSTQNIVPVAIAETGGVGSPSSPHSSAPASAPCAYQRAEVIHTLRIDSTRSFVDAFYQPAQVISFVLPPVSFCLTGDPCPPPPIVVTPPPDLPAHYVYVLDGWLELTQYPASIYYSANAHIQALSLHTDSPYQSFKFIRAPGIIADNGSAHFTEGPCAFDLTPSLCGVIGGVAFGKGDGSFDGTTLFLVGDETRDTLDMVAHTDYRFTVYATVADISAAAVPEPGTLVLAASGLILPWIGSRRRRQSFQVRSGGPSLS